MSLSLQAKHHLFGGHKPPVTDNSLDRLVAQLNELNQSSVEISSQFVFRSGYKIRLLIGRGLGGHQGRRIQRQHHTTTITIGGVHAL